MLFVLGALKIACKQVIVTIVSIIIFQYANEFVKTNLLSGVPGFFLTIYLSNKIKGTVFRYAAKFKKAMFSKKSKKRSSADGAIDLTKLEYIDLSETPLDDLGIKRAALATKIMDTMKADSQNQVFNYIFNASSHSSLFNLLTIIGVEYMRTNYDYSIAWAILYCVSFPFFICFGSSYAYASILSDEWQTAESQEKPNVVVSIPAASVVANETKCPKKVLVVYNEDKSDAPDLLDPAHCDYVCLWTTHFDTEIRQTKVELKFLSSRFEGDLREIINNYIFKYVSLSNAAQIATYSTPKIFNFHVPDYYDNELVFSRAIKEKGFKLVESWIEYTIFPLIHLKKHSYENVKLNEPNVDNNKKNVKLKKSSVDNNKKN